MTRQRFLKSMMEMVYLSRIYTKTGDCGETSLGDGARVPKDHARVTAYGEVDELNAVLGMLLAQQVEVPEATLLQSIQNDLFDIGADLCLREEEREMPGRHLRVQPGQAERLEQAIDRLNGGLAPLKSFVLPGGSALAAWCHLARTVCRRAERAVVTLARVEKVNPQVPIYLNRLSDLLFVLARVYNKVGEGDVLWIPGKTGAGQGAGSTGTQALEKDATRGD
ncbi:MAG TPA: cob(I)yrinic acid a,c-diamide adenosyltransferase [Gemmataceae bacterium]|nr:cob(I)yrinic acid a,c-diamide adenosyltransferase [Gemmataceae bacterium]